ncbi:MAG: hypothetical protein P4L35_13615 [Ignavibacteriaceae bacterium]|nr:hypothetical protein [Ignavibacteriaceae bacterium]
MKSTSLSDGSGVQFNSIGKDIVKLLNQYTEIQLSKIPPIKRPHFPNRNKITARIFIKTFQRYYLKKLMSESNIPDELVPIAELYISLVNLCSTAKQSLKPFEEYELWRSVLQSLLYPVGDENVNNSIGYCHDDSYLFDCIFKIIHNKWDLNKLEKAVLNHCFGYSHKYRIMTEAEIAEKMNVPKNKVHQTAAELEKDVDCLISKFKILRSYFYYRTNGELNENVNEIRPSLCEYIKEQEGNETMTNLFIAKVLSITCEFELVVIFCIGKNHYLLIKPGMKRSKINIKFYKGIKSLLDPEMRTLETLELFEGLAECVEDVYPEETSYFIEQEKNDEEQAMLENYPIEGGSVGNSGNQEHEIGNEDEEEDSESIFLGDIFNIDSDELDDLEFREGQQN